MMKPLAFVLFLSIPHFLSAEDSVKMRKEEKYQRYLIALEGFESLKLELKINYETLDGCNTFSLPGSWQSIRGYPKPYRGFYANMRVIGTRIFCPPLDKPRVIPLKSKELIIKPRTLNPDNEFLEILAPESMELVVNREPHEKEVRN